MSLELIDREFKRFLTSDAPEVMCIRGEWGTGKTYAWNRSVTEAKERIALKRYSYVSLFGVDSLADFKYSVFENTIQRSEIGKAPSLKTVLANIGASGEGFGRKLATFAPRVPFLKDYVGELGAFWFLTVKNTLICVDDIERRGEGLSIRDVMGLVSNLKEQRSCKVILILNDSKLDENRRDFEQFYEKVVDVSLKFAPTPEESTRIAVSTATEAGRLLSDSCIKLGVSNIRVIKKVEHAVVGIEPMLRTFDPQVLQRVVHSLTLLAWSVFEPGKAPSVDFLKRRTIDEIARRDKTEPMTETEAAWSALLGAYRYTNTDEFDLVLLDGVSNGYFDSSLVEKHAVELDRGYKAAKQDNSLMQSWRLYHDSFKNNETEVLDSIYQATIRHIDRCSVGNIDGAVRVLKRLGRPEQAREIIDLCIRTNSDNPRYFDIESYPFGKITEPEIVEAFQAKLASFKDLRRVEDILLSILKTHSWTDSELAILAHAPPRDYYEIFKKAEGDELHKYLDACFQFDRSNNATPLMKAIPPLAKEALRKIGEESAINALRVERYGIKFD